MFARSNFKSSYCWKIAVLGQLTRFFLKLWSKVNVCICHRKMFLSGYTAVTIYSRAVALRYTTNSQWSFFHGGVHCTQTKWYTQFNKWFCTLYIPPVLWIPLDTVLVFQRDNYYAFHSPEIEITDRCAYV